MVATNVFGMKIDVADIKVIMRANESKMMLDYAQESRRAGWDRKRSEVIMVRGRIRAGGERGGKRRGGGGRGRERRRENKNKKQMEWKKIVKILEVKCWKMALNKYLNKTKNQINNKKKKVMPRMRKKKIKKKKIEE